MKRLLCLLAVLALALAGCNQNQGPQTTEPLEPTMGPDVAGPPDYNGNATGTGMGNGADGGTGTMSPPDGPEEDLDPPPPPPPLEPMPQTHTVAPKETLWSIAEQYYGDGKQWKKIAAANDIDDPTKVAAGTVLTIP